MNVSQWLKYFADLFNLYNDKSVSPAKKKEIRDELSLIGIAITVHLIKHKEFIEPETISEFNNKIVKLNLSKVLKI